MSFRIYRIINTINSKSYIGFTKKTIQKRFAEHVYKAIRRNSHYRIHQAIRKYGPEAFTIVELVEADDEEQVLNVLEPLYIAEYDSINNGYNTLPGGRERGTYRHTDEARYKMSKNNHWRGKDRSGEKNPMWGREQSAKVKAAVSDANRGNQYRLGTQQTEETKAKISDKALARYANGFVNARKGVTLSDETKEKLSKAKQGKVAWTKTHLVTFPDGHTEEVLNLAEFCRNHFLHKGNMSSVASGKLKQHKGFTCTILNTN